MLFPFSAAEEETAEEKGTRKTRERDKYTREKSSLRRGHEILNSQSFSIKMCCFLFFANTIPFMFNRSILQKDLYLLGIKLESCF